MTDRPAVDPREAAKIVTEVLRLRDPLRLISPQGENFDEYDGEAVRIASRLRTCTSVDDCRHMVWTVFVDQFDATTAGPEESWQELAEDIWRVTGVHWT